MTIKELLVKIGFTVETDPLRRLEGQIAGVRDRMDLMFGAQIAQKIASMVKHFGDLAGELHSAAAAAGLAVEEFQKLQFSASLNNVSAGEMQQGLRRLTMSLYQARKGSAESLQAFRSVGFTDDQVRMFGTSQQALLNIADRFSKMKDPIEKSALATQLFGRGSQNMVAWLSQGSKAIRAEAMEAERLGIILSTKQVAALKGAEDAFVKLKAVMQGVTAQAAAELAPSLQFLIEDLIEFWRVNKDIIQLNMKEWFFNFTYALGYIWGVVKGVTQAFFDFSKAIGLEKEFAKFVGIAGTVVGFLMAISIAAKAVAFAFGLINLSLLPYIALLGIVIGLIHDIYTLFNGGKTWGEMLSDKIGDMAVGVAKARGWFGLGENGGGIVGSSQAALAGAGGGGSANQNYTVNAPMEFNIQGSADPEAIATRVQEAVSQHLNRTSRETKRSFAGPVVY